MASAQHGDALAYERLLEELLPFVRGVVRARLGDDPNAEDAVQDVLLAIHTARHTFQAGRELEPWVRTIARNAVIDSVRRRNRQRARIADVEADTLPARTQERASPEAEPLPRAMERAIEQLPAVQREAVLLLKVEGLSVAEAAQRARTTPGALKLRAHRGYRSLRDLLGRELA
ncbi:MAG TPA: sigma-70 family RNA polymerase sigma factor [Myxococcota bacterium]|jgi:RNA polymerase sigma-70 factor (ECF subfamily)